MFVLDPERPTSYCIILDPERPTSYCIIPIDYAAAQACMVRVGKTGTIPHNNRKEELCACFVDDGNKVAKKD